MKKSYDVVKTGKLSAFDDECRDAVLNNGARLRVVTRDTDVTGFPVRSDISKIVHLMVPTTWNKWEHLTIPTSLVKQVAWTR